MMLGTSKRVMNDAMHVSKTRGSRVAKVKFVSSLDVGLLSSK